MRGSPSHLWLMAVAVVLAACGPAAQQTVNPAPAAESQGQSRTLTIAARYEPPSLATKSLRQTAGGIRSTTRLFNAELDLLDDRQTPRPYLAEALPQLGSDSWRVEPDGRMETRYWLKPGLTWHDGVGVSAEDFVFAWAVYATPAFGVSGSRPLSLMEEISAPDERTVVIRWRQPYPDAGVLADGFQPLPRHILEEPFRRQDADSFVNLPHWSSEYVGLGPYRLERWEPGAFIEGAAFAGHVLGRPKIDRIVVRIFADENVVLTNLLSENVQAAAGRSLRFEHGTVLKREWGVSGKGTVLFSPGNTRHTNAQTRADVAEPRAILDLRVRKALVHAIDKQALNDGLFDGEGLMADAFLNREILYLQNIEQVFAEIDRAIAKYPYDLRRTEQLMNEAGFTRGRDGFYANAAGERFSMEAWGDSGPQLEKELAIMAETWNRAGIEARSYLLPAAQLRDLQKRSSFPAVYSTSSKTLEELSSATIPTAGNRWTGRNLGGWSNAEYDRLWDAFNSTLDSAERIQRVVEMVKLASQELPAWGLYYNPSVAAHLAVLQGPNTADSGTDVWNVHEWELR